MPASQAPTEPRPQTLPELFWAFTGMALQGFGGVLAVVQRERFDKKHLLTREQFVEGWVVAQLPLLWLLAAGGGLGWFGLI